MKTQKSDEHQRELVDFEDEKQRINDQHKQQVNERLGELCNKYPKSSIFLKPSSLVAKKVVVKPDDMKPYKIAIGKEEQWNFQDFMEQNNSSDMYTELQRIYGMDRSAQFLFSGSRDAYDNLQSEHAFLSGKSGMGKTNLCSLITVGFPKRPNPTLTLWISQKPATAANDVPKITRILENAGKKAVLITVGEPCDEGRLPVDVLQLDDVRYLFLMSKAEFQIFQGIHSSYKRTGSGIVKALGEFVTHSKGARFAALYDGLIYGNIFAIKKKEQLQFHPQTTYFLDISQLLRTESHEVADIITNGWMNYLYEYVSRRRKEVAVNSEQDDYYKQQYQGMIVFDEFYELANAGFSRTMKTVAKIGTQGRQEGTSLVVASQTVFGGTKKEKIPLSQANHIFQFKSSSMADQMFVMRSMGWEGGQYQNQLVEVFNRLFPYTKDPNAHKGKVVLFSKDSNTITSAKLKMLE